MDLQKLIETLDTEIKRLGLISIGEAAKLRGVSRSAVLQLIQRGRLKTATIAGKQLVYREEIENFTNQKPGPSVGTVFKLKP